MGDRTDDLRPLSEVVRASLDTSSSVDRKVARALLANYPIAGLETVAELAERANVSPSSVVRFVGRLGFSGYPAFQKRLMREVHEQLGSPLEQYGRADLGTGDGDLAHRCVHAGETPMVGPLFRRAMRPKWESGPGRRPDSRCQYRTDVLC